MRKIVLFIAALLFMAVPVMAVSNVDITCTVDGNHVTVSYESDANLIRAFGLDVNVVGANITKVVPVDADYRIYPGQIVIVDGNVTDYNTPYAPGDLGDHKVTVEMGSLYTMDSNYAGDPNAGYLMNPGLSGTLLRFYVSGSCTYDVTENAIRGGIVMEDPTEEPVVTLCSGSVVILQELDFGDAPNTYPTLLASGGPSHVAIGPMLGAARDIEPDGQPSANCTLDDTTGVPDDEDGITNLIATSVTAGSVTVNASATCLLNAWVDFTNDGDFADAGEQIFTNRALVAGPNLLVFVIPAVRALDTQLVSRWRVNTVGGLSYGGPAVDGEVEDYKVGPLVACMKATTTPASIRTDWVTWLKPRCWCYERNCRGDADGIQLGVYWVASADLNLLKSAYMKTVAVLQTIPNGICADFDHLPLGVYRVASSDLNTLKTYYMKPVASVPVCVQSPNYYFWCTPPATCPANF